MPLSVPQRSLLPAPSRTARKVMALVMLLAQVAPPGSRAASLSTTGRWSSTGDLGVVGTHVVLLREPQSNAAKVFLFGESGTNQKMKLWRFFASDSLRLPRTSSGDTTTALLDVPHPDTTVNDLFCNGHSVLPDGRMLFIGGNYQPRNACETVYTFDPGWIGGASPWTIDATMAAERWYATATALPDGRILASAGEARSWFGAFGGDTTGGASDRMWRSLAFGARYYWGDTTAVPGDGPSDNPRVRLNHFTAGQFPPGRTDHAAAGIPSGNAIVFGGRNVSGGGAITTLGDAWRVQDSPVLNDSVVTWIRLNQVDYIATPGVPEDVPCARSRAAMVWAGTSWDDSRSRLPDAIDSLTCFLFGGLDASGHVLSDLWVGHVRPAAYRYDDAGTPIGYVQDLAWTRLLADDDATRARFGHSLWFDPGDAGPGAPYARLVVFGGKVDSTTLASNNLYTYGVGNLTPHVWQVASAAADAGWGTPQARQAAMSTTQRPRGIDPERKFFLFGGQDAAGNLLPKMPGHEETNDTHLWALQRTDTTAGSPAYAWRWLAWSHDQPGRPTSRARGAMAYDSWSSRLVLVGGDVNGEAQPGGLTGEVWCIQIESYGGGQPALKWFPPMQRDRGFPYLPATAGLSLVAYGNSGYINESSMEAYDTTGVSAACTPWSAPKGKWTTVTTQTPESQRAISAYPFLFVLADGRLFNAGPSPADQTTVPYRRFYSLTTNQWSENDTNHTHDAAVMGSAVMFRPGKVLRAGSHGPGDAPPPLDGIAHNRTETIEIDAGQMPAWSQPLPDFESTWPLTARLNHNLTVLPTGDVIATGGVTKKLPPYDNGVAIRSPQLWRVVTGGWTNGDTSSSTRLALDPRTRNYHSAALLLPDGRVMTSGGEEPNLADRVTVSIYEPPYLFSGDSYAHRPAIADGPEVLRYGEPFTLTLADSADLDSIRSVALLRPAAVTHGFDQNQRYVPLDFVARHDPHRLLAWAPADSNCAPPGEYMLFVTLGRGTSASTLPVPSIAKWVVVHRPAGSQRDSLDVVPPRGGTYLDLRKVNACEATPAVRLRWNAPADDDTVAFSGRAKGYNLRWTLNDNPPPFDQWTAKPTAAPQAVFSTEEVLVDGLQNQVWYRFAMKAIGDNADSSALSNELVTNAVQCDDGGSSGGGGGSQYGTRARPMGRIAFGQPETGAPSLNENTLFPGVPLGSPAHDLLRLREAPGLVGSLRRAYVRQGQRRGLLITRARLLAVDHAEGSEVVPTPTGDLLAGSRAAALLVRDRSGGDVTAQASGASVEPVYADSGEVLELNLAEQAEPGPRTLLFEMLGGGSAPAGVRVQRETSAGTWEDVATLNPRREWDAVAVPGVAARRLRLEFGGAFALRYAGELAAATAVTPQVAALAGAVSAYAGDVFDAGQGSVDTTLAMVAGDTLSLLFADLPAPEAGARTWLLEVAGTSVAPALAQALASRRQREEPVSMPMAFALHPAAPNPTRGTVRLVFDLPVRAHARLEVFDAQGRRVRRIEGDFVAGRQAFEWDLRHSGGTRVAPGIFSYRLTAGAYRAQKKLVVLP